MKQEKLVVIDGHALIHRAYHAIPPLTTKSGEVVNAVYGFTMILLNVIRDLKPDYCAVAFDLPGKTKRHEEYEHYKAHRTAPPDDLVSQFAIVRRVVETFNIPVFTLEGYEADDVIGTIVKNVPENIESFIVTGDMDELQLVDDNTKVYTMRRGFTDTVIYDEAAIKEKYGLTPTEFIDYKALKGDPSDNIPGVAGVGEKTATDLVGTYGSLDNIYKNLEEIKPAVAKKLEAEKEIAYLSKKLATIHTDLSINVDLKKCLVCDYEKSKVYSLFQELGFKSLLSRLPQTQENSLFQEEAQPKATKIHLKSVNYCLVNTIQQLDELANQLAKQNCFAFDTETDSISQVEANLVGMSFSFKEGEAFYIPVSHDEGQQLQKELVLERLKPILENEKIGKIGHNIKYDYVVMKNHGINISGIIFDTMIAAYLLNPNARAQSLSDLAFSEFGIEMTKIEELIGKGKNQLTFNCTKCEDACIYAAEDADVTWRLYLHLKKELKENDQEELLSKIEMPLITVLGDMELAGIKLDSAKLEKSSVEIAERIEELRKSICKRGGEEFNIGSPAQLTKILFEKLKLQDKFENIRELKKLKSGSYSTNAQELEKLRGLDPIIEEIFEYRELTKLKNTYIDVLPKLVNSKTGRIHTNYNQAITQTGRLSSSDPNLQNIPIRTAEGKKIREAFVADEGQVLISADYSQIELRVVAHIAKDREMLSIFKEGRDIHTETAAKVYGVTEAKVTPAMRRIAKIINFGIIYGVSAHGLKQQTGLSREEGQKLIDKYFTLHPAIKEYTKKMVEQAKELGYVETIFGRRRYLSEIKSNNFAVRGAAERMAINMPVQGTAADLMKLAMIDVAQSLPKYSPKSTVLLQVHDELIVETPATEAEKVAEFLKTKMDKVVELSVPIETSVHWGKNWGEAKE